MLRMSFSKLMSMVFIMFFVATFLFTITEGAKAGKSAKLSPSSQGPITTEADDIVAGYWDLRNRESFFQVTNVGGAGITVHVQVWNGSDPVTTDRCVEFDFFDTYTGNDTHIYNLRDLQTNNGSVIFPPAFNAGHGYIYVSVTGAGCTGDKVIIGNHRIIDIPGGYEYRSAALGMHDDFDNVNTDTYGFNFNSVDGASFSDVIPVFVNLDTSSSVCRSDPTISGVVLDTVTLAEIRQSCPFRNIGCKPEPADIFLNFPTPRVNVGINNALVNSRGGLNLCSDSTPNGWVLLTLVRDFLSNPGGAPLEGQCFDGNKSCAGLVGINNGDGTGSMESWTALDRTNNYHDIDE